MTNVTVETILTNPTKENENTHQKPIGEFAHSEGINSKDLIITSAAVAFDGLSPCISHKFM